MTLLTPRKSLLLALSLAGLTACFKQQKAPEAPKRGAQSSDQCGTKSKISSPAPSGGAYLAGVKGTWEEVKTLLERDCTSCHPTYTDHDIAKLLAAKFVKTTDDGTMPKNGERLNLEDRTVYILWANNGAPKDGAAGSGGSSPEQPEVPTVEDPAVDDESGEENDDEGTETGEDESESDC